MWSFIFLPKFNTYIGEYCNKWAKLLLANKLFYLANLLLFFSGQNRFSYWKGQITCKLPKKYTAFSHFVPGEYCFILLLLCRWNDVVFRCGPCQFMVPVLEEVSEKLKDKIQVVKIDTEKYVSIANRYRIEALPTFIIFRDGKPCDRFVSLQPTLSIIV